MSRSEKIIARPAFFTQQAQVVYLDKLAQIEDLRKTKKGQQEISAL